MRISGSARITAGAPATRPSRWKAIPTTLAEVLEAASVRCTTQLLGFDEKRMHYFHRMYREDDGALAATMELMAVHVDLGRRKVVPMPDGIQSRLGGIFLAHASLDRPPQVGRVMHLGNPVRK